MNGLGINNASKNDKDTAILMPEEVALLRTRASDGRSRRKSERCIPSTLRR